MKFRFNYVFYNYTATVNSKILFGNYITGLNQNGISQVANVKQAPISTAIKKILEEFKMRNTYHNKNKRIFRRVVHSYHNERWHCI